MTTWQSAERTRDQPICRSASPRFEWRSHGAWDVAEQAAHRAHARNGARKRGHGRRVGVGQWHYHDRLLKGGRPGWPRWSPSCARARLHLLGG
eukprot:scaffold31041_cov69-Phaeocystis_antarctica.AAC.5